MMGSPKYSREWNITKYHKVGRLGHTKLVLRDSRYQHLSLQFGTIDPEMIAVFPKIQLSAQSLLVMARHQMPENEHGSCDSWHAPQDVALPWGSGCVDVG